MSEDELNEYLLINDRLLVSNFCRTTIGHGGTAIYSRYSSQQVKVNQAINSLSVELDCDLCCVEVVDLDLVLVTVYRSMNGDFISFLNTMEKVLSYINRLDKKSIICGDFNLKFLTSDKDADQFVNLCLTYGLQLTIHEPTRGKNCLDNFFTSLTLQNCTATVINCHVSDHLGQLLIVNNTYKENSSYLAKKELSYMGPSLKTVPILSDSNINVFRFYLAKEKWSDILFAKTSVNEMFNAFMLTVRYYFNLSFNKQVKIKRKNTVNIGSKANVEWYTDELCAKKDRLHLLYEHLKSSKGHEFEMYNVLYKSEKKDYRKQIKHTKKQYNSKLVKESGNQSKTLWQIVNKSRKGETKTKDPNIFSSDEYNRFFINIASNVKPKLNSVAANGLKAMQYVNNCKVPEHKVGLSFSYVTEKIVLDAVSHLSSKYSKDHYGLSNVLLKKIIDCILNPLTRLINLCLAQGIFPDCLKISKVIPIFKKGKKDDLNNYRPITVVPVFSKVLELIIGKQLMVYFELNRLICNNQFGYRNGLSTTHALIKLVEGIHDCFEGKDLAAVTFCDLSKAFDCVSHDLIVSKLEYFRVKGVALQIFQSYLENRVQYVQDSNESSCLLPVTCGVPQGSVLGPLLFIIMVNDLSSNIPAEIILYADDTTVLNRHDSESLALENAKYNQTLIENWLAANELVLNKEKTKTVLFSLKEKNMNLDSPMFLGLTLDPTLNWHQHISVLKSRLSKSIYALKRLSGELEREGLRQAYFGLFHAHMSYGLIVWGGAPKSEDIFVAQKKAIRVITGSHRLAHCKQLFIELRILTLHSLYIFQCLMYLRANLDKVHTRSSIHSHNTRSANLINLPQNRLLKSERNPIVISSRLMNKLPDTVKNLENDKFKICIINFLLKNPFYKVEEFLSESWSELDFSLT
ncbi:uncharacterized protein LOC124356940 isoform X1 [Homalodisca vitripennis]|uniref:uncharacterized protein LOC124356940 isoform X1 n=1 Tax=Homalodisca vitripennis TaxID=197043 RepID=UPI001EEBCD59|nr:uncharacterized protein LOC124356940 isoform X1 [Homalodisca vitripennis]XP_046664213.1 uncharacterized protein LOC124356940 isoform X1 [Homalodisca vitripennis]XP_046664214.1 uncharacterized protein LOC124356940 isoform X1 [Homalodisca vitripennis]